MCWSLWLPAPETTREHTLERVLKRLPEIPIEIGVDERIQGGVEVADPEEHGDQDIGASAGRLAEGRNHIPEEKRKPAEHKRTHDDTQSSGSFMFRFPTDRLMANRGSPCNKQR